jgi:hypothetical protein
LIPFYQIDTGLDTLVTYYFKANTTGPKDNICVIQNLDGVNAAIKYFSTNSSCDSVAANLQLGSLKSRGVIEQTEKLFIKNPTLHDYWLENGVIGLSYSDANITAFQSLLANVSDGASNQTFGLDFRNSGSPIASVEQGQSSMQLGGVKATYEERIRWSQQAQSQLSKHLFFLENLQFCGVQLLGNYSTNWEVLIDTGSSCLTLPGEIYDSLTVWFSNSTIVTSYDRLPALSFNVIGANETLFIPLANLILPTNAISSSEKGAPYVQSVTSKNRLCLIRGGNIRTTNGKYNNPPQQVVFGSLVLQSIYFAADFSTGGVGLANKLYPSEVTFYSNPNNPSCQRPLNCTGTQMYRPFKNKCKQPKCSKYFFMELDSSNGVCVYSQSAIGFGLFFIVLIVLLEVFSFFIYQYSSHTIWEGRRATGETLIKIDALTLLIGKYLSMVADLINVATSFLNSIYASMIAQPHAAVVEPPAPPGREV